MAFHRLNANPAGYDAVPVGFDFINDPVANGYVGSPALADGIKMGGPNNGSYYYGFGEDVLSLALNRAAKALSENTDWLDEQVRRPIAVMASVADTVPGPVGITTITLPDASGVYLGSGGGSTPETLETLFQIVDQNFNEIILQATGARVYVTAIDAGGALGSGFAAAPVTLHLSQTLPVAAQYQVIYGLKGNLTTTSVDSMVGFQPRAAVRTGAEVEDLFRRLRAPAAMAEPWNATPFHSTVWDLTASGLNDRYNRATSVNGALSPPDDYFSAINDLNSFGGGAWFLRYGPAVTGYAISTDGASRYNDPAEALFAAKLRDTGAYSGATGLVVHGARRTTTLYDESEFSSGFASFVHLDVNQPTALPPTEALTRIEKDAPISVQTVGGRCLVNLLDANHYFARSVGIPGGVASAIAPGYDMLEIVWDTGIGIVRPHMYVVTQVNSPSQVEVCALDGTTTDFPGAALVLPTGLRAWHRMACSIADGSMVRQGRTSMNGLFFSSLPFTTYDSGTGTVGAHDDFDHGIAEFYGPGLSGAAVLKWGWFMPHFQSGVSQPGYAVNGTLNADGSVSCQSLTAVDTVSGASLQQGTYFINGGATAAYVVSVDMSVAGTVPTRHIQLESAASGSVTVNITHAKVGVEYTFIVERPAGDLRATMDINCQVGSGGADTSVSFDALDRLLSNLSLLVLPATWATFDVYRCRLVEWDTTADASTVAKLFVTVERFVDTYGG